VAKEKVQRIKERLSDLERNEIDEVTDEIRHIEEQLQLVEQLQEQLKRNSYEKNLEDKKIKELTSHIKIYTGSYIYIYIYI